MNLPIYMDAHSTTPVDPLVVEAMLPYFTQYYGNASSRTHVFGWHAAEAVASARQQVAELAGAETKDVVFTSGATEAINVALQGWSAKAGSSARLITTDVEHSAVLDTARALEQRGFHVTYLPVRRDATLDLARLEEALHTNDGPTLVSIMHANNEVGTIYPIEEIGALCSKAGALLHVDACQSFGKLRIAMHHQNIDLLSVSSHKLYGPKGAGALIIRRRSPRVRLSPVYFGGGHERELRPGTLNVPAIVGFGAACELAASQAAEDSTRLAQFRDRLLENLRSEVPKVQVNGTMDARLPHNLNVSFPGVEGESLIMALRDVVAVSSGSACTSAKAEPSHVLRAMGLSKELAHSSIRFGLLRGTTGDQVDLVAKEVGRVVRHLRSLAPIDGDDDRQNIVAQ